MQSPIWFIYPGLGSQWPAMGKTLMKIPLFANSIKKCEEALMSEGINLIKIITENDPKIMDSIINVYVGITAINVSIDKKFLFYAPLPKNLKS